MSTTPRSAKTTDYRHGNLRAALIEAGRQALKTVGPHEVSLRSLARMAGVSEAAPSRHFSGIDELLATIAATGFRELAALRIEIRDAKASPMTTAYRMMHVYVDFAQKEKGLFGLMIGPRIVDRNFFPELDRESKASFSLFADAIHCLAAEHGWKKSHFNLLTHAAWAMEHGLAMLIICDRIPRSEMPLQVEPLVQFAIGTTLSGITAGPEHFLAAESEIGALKASGHKRKPVS